MLTLLLKKYSTWMFIPLKWQERLFLLWTPFIKFVDLQVRKVARAPA